MKAKQVNESLFIPKSKSDILDEFKDMYLNKIFRKIGTRELYYAFDVIMRDDNPLDVLVLIEPLFNKKTYSGVMANHFLSHYVELTSEDIKHIRVRNEAKKNFLKTVRQT